MQTDGRTERQTGMMKIIVAFLCFAEAPKNDPGGKIINVWSGFLRAELNSGFL